jgi:hypothetical protein
LSLVTPLGGCSAILVLMMLLLDDFLGVRDVSWVSHQFIDDSQRSAGRISRSHFVKNECTRLGHFPSEVLLALEWSSALNQINDQDNDRNHEQQMD